MKAIRKIILLTGCLFLACIASAQEGSSNQNNSLTQKNMVDVTIGGTGLTLSTNYSRIVLIKPKYFINTSAGIGFVPYNGGITFPHQITFNLGKHTSFLEMGLGGTYANGLNTTTSNLESKHSYHLSPILGWRKYFKSNLVFRIYASPLIHISGEHFINTNKIMPFAGVGLGYTF